MDGFKIICNKCGNELELKEGDPVFGEMMYNSTVEKVFRGEGKNHKIVVFGINDGGAVMSCRCGNEVYGE